MPIGFKNCCCKKCNCERTWPGDSGSVHAIWNVNQPILGTTTSQKSLVERSSSTQLYTDYPFSVDPDTPYWISTGDGLWIPGTGFGGDVADDWYIAKRIRISHPDLPHFTHNVACAPRKIKYGEEMDAIGTTYGSPLVWSTPFYDFRYLDNANSVIGGDEWRVRDEDLRCWGFWGHPSPSVGTDPDAVYHWIWGSGQSGIGLDGPPNTTNPPVRTKVHIDTYSGFLFTSELFPDKHFHRPGDASTKVWESDLRPCQYYNRWPTCGFVLQINLKYGSSFLSTYLPFSAYVQPWTQRQAMCGRITGFQPFPFIPAFGTSPLPSTVTATEVERFWELYLAADRGYLQFSYTEWVRLSNGFNFKVVEVTSPSINPYNPDWQTDYMSNCRDGNSWPLQLRVWKWAENPYPWAGQVYHFYNCTVDNQWIAV